MCQPQMSEYTPDFSLPFSCAFYTGNILCLVKKDIFVKRTFFTGRQYIKDFFFWAAQTYRKGLNSKNGMNH